MNKTSTNAGGQRQANKTKGKSEKLLLLAIMAIGILGLTFSYSTRKSEPAEMSASANDTTSSDGKIQSDKMILHLNQRSGDSQQTNKVSRF
jgi:hypothetical protein